MRLAITGAVPPGASFCRGAAEVIYEVEFDAARKLVVGFAEYCWTVAASKGL
jgi:hypothetical protein